jgi:intracellular septation protein
MGWIRRHFPFNREQTVNILSEFGPLITMFVVNAAAGIDAGTWALLISTVVAMVTMRMVLGRLPVFPLIASTVTIVFGALTLLTGDPMWVQIKVTIFNALFAAFLFLGLALKRNFFKYVFEKTFHYTDEGWNRFTWSFAWFFVFTAVANEVVRQTFKDVEVYDVLGYEMNGVNIWILFKIAFIMPLSGLYAWFLTRLMQKHRLPDGGTGAEEPKATTVTRPAAGGPVVKRGGLKYATVVAENKPPRG